MEKDRQSGGREEPDEVRTGPLDGVRILDLTRILAGPTCTQLLGDFGADVVKIERPGLGDDTRAWGPPYIEGTDGNPTRESAYYLSANRNKRSFAVDIASEEGADAVRKLILRSDVLIENFKRGGLAQYGLDYESARKLNPALVYCSITGFGQTGPLADKPGYDILIQAFGGIMSVTGEPDGEPMKTGVAIADIVCGLYASTAMLAALLHRARTGQGQHIDLALADTQIAWLVNVAENHLVSGKPSERLGNQHPNIVPYQVFKAADGYVVVAAGNDFQFERFCHILGRPELASDNRYRTNASRVQNRKELIPMLADEIRKMPKTELIEKMETAKVPGGPINSVPEVLASSHVAERGMRIAMPYPHAKGGMLEMVGNPVKFSATPVAYRRAPPVCGEHTEEVLSELKDRKRQPKKPAGTN